MRIYPPAYAISRRALCEVEIDGYHVPKNWVVLIAPYTLHRRTDYFPDPEKFDPDRFSPEREKQLHATLTCPLGLVHASALGCTSL